MNATLKSYIIGFTTSLLLVLAAFTMVEIHVKASHEVLPHTIIIPVILVLALAQLAVQLKFFLHLGNKSSRWNLAFFISTLAIIFVIIAASLIIMKKLNYNMTPEQVGQYLQDQGSY